MVVRSSAAAAVALLLVLIVPDCCVSEMHGEVATVQVGTHQGSAQARKGIWKWMKKKAKKAGRAIKKVFSPKSKPKRQAIQANANARHTSLVFVPGTMNTNLEFREIGASARLCSKLWTHRYRGLDSRNKESKCRGTQDRKFPLLCSASNLKKPRFETLWINALRIIPFLGAGDCAYERLSMGIGDKCGRDCMVDGIAEVRPMDGNVFGAVEGSEHMQASLGKFDFLGQNNFGKLVDVFSDDLFPLEDMIDKLSKDSFTPYRIKDRNAIKYGQRPNWNRLPRADIFNAGHDWRRTDRTMLLELHKNLKQLVEVAYRSSTDDSPANTPIVMAGHSQGAVHMINFVRHMQMAHPGWCERYIGAIISLGGPFDGSPNAIAQATWGDPMHGIFDPVKARWGLLKHTGSMYNNGIMRYPPELLRVGKFENNGPKAKWIDEGSIEDLFPDAEDPLWEVIKQANPTDHPAWKEREKAYEDAKIAGITSPHMFHNKNINPDMKTHCDRCRDVHDPRCWQCSDLPDVLTYFVAGLRSGPDDFGNKHLRFEKTGKDKDIRYPSSKKDYEKHWIGKDNSMWSRWAPENNDGEVTNAADEHLDIKRATTDGTVPVFSALGPYAQFKDDRRGGKTKFCKAHVPCWKGGHFTDKYSNCHQGLPAYPAVMEFMKRVSQSVAAKAAPEYPVAPQMVTSRQDAQKDPDREYTKQFVNYGVEVIECA